MLIGAMQGLIPSYGTKLICQITEQRITARRRKNDITNNFKRLNYKMQDFVIEKVQIRQKLHFN